MFVSAWAIKRGYYTAKASRPDVYRAANELLRMALDGRLCLSLRPRGFHARRAELAADEEVKRLEEVVRGVEETCRKNAATYLNLMRQNSAAAAAAAADSNQSYDGDDDSDEFLAIRSSLGFAACN